MPLRCRWSPRRSTIRAIRMRWSGTSRSWSRSRGSGRSCSTSTAARHRRSWLRQPGVEASLIVMEAAKRARADHKTPRVSAHVAGVVGVSPASVLWWSEAPSNDDARHRPSSAAGRRRRRRRRRRRGHARAAGAGRADARHHHGRPGARLLASCGVGRLTVRLRRPGGPPARSARGEPRGAARRSELARVDTTQRLATSADGGQPRVRPSADRGGVPPAGGGAERPHLPGGLATSGRARKALDDMAAGRAERLVVDRPLPRDVAAAGLRARDHGRRRAPLARAGSSGCRARDAGDPAARGLRTGRRPKRSRSC